MLGRPAGCRLESLHGVRPPRYRGPPRREARSARAAALRRGSDAAAGRSTLAPTLVLARRRAARGVRALHLRLRADRARLALVGCARHASTGAALRGSRVPARSGADTGRTRPPAAAPGPGVPGALAG